MTSKAEATRERLLAATKKLVMSKGFAGTSIDEVLKATGLTKGAFFHHFRSKADLADQLMRWYSENDIIGCSQLGSAYCHRGTSLV